MSLTRHLRLSRRAIRSAAAETRTRACLHFSMKNNLIAGRRLANGHAIHSARKQRSSNRMSSVEGTRRK